MRLVQLFPALTSPALDLEALLDCYQSLACKASRDHAPLGIFINFVESVEVSSYGRAATVVNSRFSDELGVLYFSSVVLKRKRRRVIILSK